MESAHGGIMFNSPNRGLLLMGNDASVPLFQGCRRSLSSFEEAIKMSASKRPSFYDVESETTADDDMEECVHQPEKKRRLTAEQVHFLEKSFEVDNKLEPERKTQLARDLGLQPRQVAVWFQNRRARWKTKQLERDYDALKSTYDALRLEYDVLLKEKDKLKSEVILLTDKLHAKENALEIQTKDLGASRKRKSLMQSSTQCESMELKHEISPSSEAMGAPLLRCKIEDPLSSGTDGSAVLDEDSPHYIDSGHSSSAVDYVSTLHNNISPLEVDHSDFSHAEEEEEEEGLQSEKLNLPPPPPPEECNNHNILNVEEQGLFPNASPPGSACTYMFSSMEDQEHLPWWVQESWP